MVKYYPEEMDFAQIIRKHPFLGFVDPVEKQRLEDVQDRKNRGKGPPKKAKTAGKFRCRSVSYPNLIVWPISPS
jgi:hypothetical protein